MPNQSSATSPAALLRREELAKRLSMSARNVQVLTKRRVIPALIIGRRCVRYDLEAVLEALQRYERKAIG